MEGIEIRDLCLNFGSVRVLEKLNLNIKQGEFIVLLGPSGCGKSTLLNCIAGLLDASEGQIFIGGRNVTWEEPMNRGIGMVFQSYALYPQMTVAGNLSFGLKNVKMPADKIKERVDKTASLLHIENLLDRKPAALSGGQRQRVAIGRALVRDVGVFLFDEPLSNLDAKLRTELRVEIKRLHQQLENNTMVYVTHDQIEALTLADRIAVMREGIIQQLADPGTIYNRPSNLYVAGFIGSPAMNMIKGDIVKGASGNLEFDCGDFKLNLTGYDAASKDNMSAGKEVVLGLRPEHISVDGQHSDDTAIGKGVIELTEPMGADILLWIKVGERTLSVRVDGNSKSKRGDECQIATEIAFSSIFDRETEIRL